MEILLYIFGILFLLLILLISLPVSLRINSRNNIYELTVFHIIKINLIYDRNFYSYFYLKVRFVFFNFEYDFIKKIAQSKRSGKKNKIKKEKKKTKKNIDFRRIIKLIKELTGSFRIHYFNINIDTTDYILNGLLIPVFYGINNRNVNLNINFNQYYEVDFKISNKPVKLIFPLFKFFIIKGDKR